MYRQIVLGRKCFTFYTLILLTILTIWPFLHASANILQPTEQVYRIYPSQLSGQGWNNLSGLAIPSASEQALPQSFDRSLVTSLQVGPSLPSEGSSIPPSIFAPQEELSDIPEDPSLENVLPDSNSDSDADETALPRESSSESVEVMPASEEISTRSLIDRVRDFLFFLPAFASETENEPVVDAVAEDIADVIEVTADSSTATDTMSSVGSLTDEVVADNLVPPQTQTETFVSSSTQNSVVLQGFGLPNLAPGETIDNVQLRISMAGYVAETEGVIPSLRATYRLGTFVGNAGSILLQGEVSNAMNGGYYLLSLPTFDDAALFNDLVITLEYQGDASLVEYLFIDAAWLEVATQSFTKEQLDARKQSLAFDNLSNPQLSELVSSQRNFGRFESPIFNLRYQSQRNFIVNAVRGLFNRDKVQVANVSIIHRDIGNTGIVPITNVTADGLVTIQIPQEERERLRPGHYTIEIVYDEGGKIFTDNFDFQWGLLTLNPQQSEFGPNEQVQISFGSLSPNGNTVCDADLRLYITSPDDAVMQPLVIPSGLCNGNNVIDVPDYTALYMTHMPGTYEMYLERLDDAGGVIAFTTDTFLVVDPQTVVIERVGPTRIYPVAAYPMQVTVRSVTESFNGRLVERVPANFSVLDTGGASVVDRGSFKELVWDVSLSVGASVSFEYTFDAPDISPFLFELGPARLETNSGRQTRTEDNIGEVRVDEVEAVDSEVGAEEGLEDTVSGTNEAESIEEEIDGVVLRRPDRRLLVSDTNDASIVFTEHRAWQIASDATGSMLLLWDNPSIIPTGWTCVSCTSGQPFFERFIMGSSTPGNVGGALTHTHTVSSVTVIGTNDLVTVQGNGSNNRASVGHTHTATLTIGTASNLPEYRNLVIIQHDSAGEPATLPAGAIAIFDAAVPAGWTQYNDQNGRYVRGAAQASIGGTGGSNTHTHAVTGSLNASVGADNANTGGAISIAEDAHTHAVNDTLDTDSNEPPYVEVILGKLTSTSTPVNAMIGMWTDEEPAGWDVVSGAGQPFENRFFKATSTYGATGGSASHTPADQTVVSGGPSATIARGGAGATRPSGTHIHTISLEDFSVADHLPPFRTVLFAKRIGLDATFTQANYRWYANENVQTPTDPWSPGAFNLDENQPITLTSTPVRPTQVVRLRMNIETGNATSTTGAEFKLQYAAADVCSAATSWTDVGAAGSGALWRGFNNTSVTDGSTLSTTLLASSTVVQTYEENGVTAGTPNQMSVGAFGEWDFVLQNNNAVPGTNYCFRLVYDDDTPLFAYGRYPQLVTNATPRNIQLLRRFDNEHTVSTVPTFDFFAVDPENEKIDYQIQIASDFAFSSVVVDRNSVSNSTQFENRINLAEKNPFTSGQTIRFLNNSALSNGVTYWWRVRGRDPAGANEWGDWSTANSFTVNTALDASGWLQREDEQFERGILSGVEVYGSDQVRLITGSTTGSITSPTIDFNAGKSGTAWEQFRFVQNTTNGSILYRVQYRNDEGEWNNIPDTDLVGNATGFSSSPVSLLSLEVGEYRFIRLVATLTNSGGTPFLQEWGVDWGFRVETPSITSPFPNEKVGTTTPTFTFSTTDPQNDDLTYQIEWSTDPTFGTGVTTRTSDTNAGFVNLNDGADTDPFTSGDTILFTIQSGDALTNGTTYWWRVRAKDTTGDDEYSFWTVPRSFTVDNTVVASTWFQTTAEQFASNILSGATSVSGGVTVSTVAEEALIVYGEGSATTPRYRVWNGSEWSVEGSLIDITTATRWVVTKAATTREEYVAGVIGSNGRLYAQVYSLGEWGNATTLTTTIGSTATQGFDIAYETAGGRAMVAYCDGDNNPSYRIWDGASWSSEVSITSGLTAGNNCRWIKMVSHPTSNEIVLVMRGIDDTPYRALVWNGTTWGNNSGDFGTARVNSYSGIGVEYQAINGNAMVVVPSGNPNNQFTYRTWNGTAWSGATTQGATGRLYWAQLARNVSNNQLVMCYTSDTNGVYAIRWDGTAWVGNTTLTATANSVADPAFSCGFETSTGRTNYIMATLANTTQTQSSVWNTTTWSTAAQINSIANTATMRLIRTDNDLLLGVFYDFANTSLRFVSWNGTAWSSTQTLETNTAVTASPYGYSYDLAPRNPSTSGVVVVAPPLVFSEGNGPYWEEFSWNDTKPGTSQVVYQLQFFNGSTWQFIPNTALSGNETGFTSGPIDLSNLNVNVYGTIRPYATLTCQNAGTCPTINDWTVRWAEGITVSGTAQQYDQVTNVTGGTVAIAVNGSLQIGKTGTISAGVWSIDNVTTFPGDVLTVFVSGVADTNEAIAVSRYDGIGDMVNMRLYERHLTLGTGNPTTTPLINADIGQYDFTNTEDIFADVTAGVLRACADSGCDDVRLYIASSTVYQPGGRVLTHDVENKGTFVAGAFTHEVSGSWQNTGTMTMAGSTIVMTATSSTEIINTVGAISGQFNNLTFGTTTGNATWQLQNELDVNGNLTVTRGTLDRGTQSIIVRGTLSNEVNGFWSGIGTTTFAGSGSSNWRDLNPTLQNIGHAVIDGSAKTIILSGNVAAESITIGSNDVLDASASNFGITVFGNWTNNNTFVSRQGTVTLASPTINRTITHGSSNFHNLTFTGTGSWSFTQANVTIANNLTLSNGTVTLPTATTTVGGSWNSTGGTFAHNNGEVRFTAPNARTITVAGSAFTNNFYDVVFAGAGSWVFNDAATTTRNIRFSSGSVTLPSSTLAVGGNWQGGSGTYNGNAGTVNFFGAATHTITPNSNFASLLFSGSGAWSFTTASVVATGNVTVQSGSVTLPTTNLTIGGSYANAASVSAGTSEVIFNSNTTGRTVDFGSSPLYDIRFNNNNGGWTIVTNATTSRNVVLQAANSWTLASGQTLAVGGTFTNSVGGSATTWTGSTLALLAGSYAVNTKTNTGDEYGVLQLGEDTDISWWNSTAATYDIPASSSLYSQDHNAVDGDLYIYGSYTRATGTEYWSVARDFDGVDLSGGSERAVNVRLAANSVVTLQNVSWEVIGTSTATTTVANQGSGTYEIIASGGTTTAQFYDFNHLGATGISLLDGVIVSSFDDGRLVSSLGGGAALTVASSTVDANPTRQFFRNEFSTTSAIAAVNVRLVGGAPSSFWWFRNGSGNLYGEAFDDDDGDPGAIRFDDSSLTITVSGTVYDTDTITPLSSATCDGSTQVVRVVVDGGSSYTGSCSGVDGTYSVSGVVIVGDPVLTIYLDNAPAGEGAVVVTRTPSGDISDLDLYVRRVIVRHEDATPLSITDMAVYTSSNDTDVLFAAATGTLPSLVTVPNTELYIWPNKTFATGGEVVLAANAFSNSYDGTLYLSASSTFIAYATSTYTIGGRMVLEGGASFTPASSTVLMNATTTGKSITASAPLTLNNLTIDGVGGAWHLTGDITILGNMLAEAGTVTGTANVTIPDGNFTGSGVVSMGGGTVVLSGTRNLGGTTPWTFANLTLGTGSVTGTTTLLFSTTTISGVLSISNAHFLAPGSTYIDLSGTGSMLTGAGTFVPQSSTVRYSGATANVASRTYHNLLLDAGAGSGVYTAVGLGVTVNNVLTVGSTNSSTLQLDTNNVAMAVDGNVFLAASGTVVASPSALFAVRGDWTNAGTFTANNGTVTFDTSTNTSINAGTSSFHAVLVNATGNVTVANSATTTGSFTLQNHNQFTLASGQVLAVGGVFTNGVGGSATTWTGSTLALYGNGNYQINDKTISDTYEAIEVRGSTQIRMWNSSATSYSIVSTASLYSQDHAGSDGELYVFGAYNNTSRADHWSYETDFDGTSLSGGGERTVTVRVASTASVTVGTGGSLAVLGTSTASTTITNQGSGTYSLSVTGGTTNWSYYVVRNIGVGGITFSGTPSVTSLSNGDIELAVTGGSGMTVGGTVITANPARTFTNNRFALGAAASGFNVTATGTTVSSWRFTNHTGDIAGEAFDNDPTGDPGYVVWDDSAALITISGRVYSDEGSTVSTVCDGSTNVITLRMAGLTSYQASCNASTGEYSITNVAYSPGDSFVAYIDNQTPKGATVSAAPISSISNFDIYENRVVVRHEGPDAITNTNIGVWDSGDDADIPFTVSGGNLTLPANRKLLIWTDKGFTPNGNVTITGGGAGAPFDGTFELMSGATFTAGAGRTHTIGGSLVTASTATLTTGTSEFRFTTTGSARSIATNNASLHTVTFDGSGSWSIDQTSFTVLNNLVFADGDVTLPTGTTTVGASLTTTGGTFDANDGLLLFTSNATGRTVTFGGSFPHSVRFSGTGSWSMNDTYATTTDGVVIESGSVTLPSGTLTITTDFLNNGGSIVPNSSTLSFITSATSSVRAGGSNLGTLHMRGDGVLEILDENITLNGSLLISDGEVRLATGTTAIAGSVDAAGGSFVHTEGTILLNSTAGGNTINPGDSTFNNLQFGAPSGSFTITGSATTTNNLTINAVSNLVVQSGVRMYVGGVFTNLVGGSATTWTGTTLVLDGNVGYTINTKTAGGDAYDALEIGPNTDVRSWNSQATSTIVASGSSWYSKNHAAINGNANIYGDFVIATTTEYWSYARDFDGTILTSGNERAVTVRHAQNATTTVISGTLEMIGVSGNRTTITNQGSGTYAFAITGGVFEASHYAFRQLNGDGVTISGTPLIPSLANGDYELAVDGGTLITLTDTALTNNASLVIPGARFATTTAISGFNVTLIGTTSSAWTFSGHIGNLSGEAYDVDGIEACGSIRWDDSECLLIQQTQYRWRLDNGDEGAVNSEWFDEDWTGRQRIRVINNDASSYTNAAIKLQIESDTLMRSDFADLRFTDEDGVTLLDHFIEDYDVNTEAVVWVRIPTLTAQTNKEIFMYFGNASASDVSATTTFAFAETFEGGTLPAAYGGDRSLFSVTTDFNYERTFGLDNSVAKTGRATDGIFRTDISVSQGQKLRYFQYVDTVDGSGDEVCTLFAVQTPGTNNNNYAVCLEQFGTSRISLVRNVVDNDASGIMLASSTVTFATGWYEIEIDWQTNGDISVELRKDGVIEATVSANDTTYSSGGVGFTYWFNHGGWDLYTARPRLTTEPSYFVGATQGKDGASWTNAQNTPTSAFNLGDTARLRFAVENSGLEVLGQRFLLEWASRGAAPSCEAVSGASYVAVPPAASCGSSAVCMETSTQVSNGQSTTDHLSNVRGEFVPGQIRMSPDNRTSAIDLPQNTFTEIEYVLTPTVNALDDVLCFRVTNDGIPLDTYQRVAALELQFDPVVQTDVLLNNGDNILLNAGTTTRIFTTATVVDGNGFADLVRATTTVYRSGVSALCTPDNNNCYVASTDAGSCSFISCSGAQCTLSCYTDIFFHADPTDFGTFEGQEWFAFVEVEDTSGGYGFGSVLEGVELATLRALSVDGTINYGALEPNQNTTAFSNPFVDIENIGNVEFTIDVIGTDMISGSSSVIPATQQRVATSTFDFTACPDCVTVSSTDPVPVDLVLGKPVVDNPPVAAPVYWGIAVPLNIQSELHQGVNIITPISP